MIKKYRKKPIVIEAIQWTGNNWSEIGSWMNSVKTNSIYHTNLNEVWIDTLEGIMTGGVGDYIIKGIKGEFYPCKADIFEASYDEVEE